MGSVQAVANRYDDLLNFTYVILNSIKGQHVSDPSRVAMESLAMKIFMHSASIAYLSKGTNVALSSYPEGAHLIDFASIIVLCRSVFETYLTLFEVFLDKISDDEYIYRRNTFEIAGFKVLELSIKRNMTSQTLSAQDVQHARQIAQRLESIRQTIKDTQHYKQLDTNQQRSSLEGAIFPRRKVGDIALAAGFSQELAEYFYLNMSAYVHGDSRSAAEVYLANHSINFNIHVQLYSVYVMFVLASLIRDYVDKFSEAKRIFDRSINERDLVEFLLNQKGKL